MTDPTVQRLAALVDALSAALRPLTHPFVRHPVHGLCATCTRGPAYPTHVTPEVVAAAAAPEMETVGAGE